MRHSFTLSVGFREDIRGKEQTKVSDQIQEFAANQDIQSFVLEDGNTGTFVFMARPDLIDERKDYYEIDGLRRSIESWLQQHQDIDTFTLQPITDVNEILPKLDDAELITALEGHTPSGTFFKFRRQ